MLFRKKKDLSETEVIQKNFSFFGWIQEFSKKIVVIAFLIYILLDIASLVMVIISYLQTGDLLYVDTIIVEANQTFRDVIGGYILKAATENISKGVCAVVDKYITVKTTEEVVPPSGDIDEEADDPECEDDYDIQ